MQIIVLLIMLAGLAAGLQNRPTLQSKPVVEVQCGGDDSLTRGVCRKIYNEFTSAPDFVITDEDDTGTLVVRIPTNVDWKKRGKRTRVFYVVEFLSNKERELAKKKGECWEDELGTCATQVVRQARLAARKLTARH